MSSGPYRGKRNGIPVARTRASGRKPRGEGLKTIPKIAWPTTYEVLAEQGLDGLALWCVVYHLGATDFVRSELAAQTLTVFTANRDRQFHLPLADAKAIKELLAWFELHTQGLSDSRKMVYISEILFQKVQPEVRERLRRAGHLWADQVNVNIRTLKKTGALVVADHYREHWEYGRAYLRSPHAAPWDGQNAISEQVVEAYSSAVSEFWGLVAEQLSEEARSAIWKLSR